MQKSNALGKLGLSLSLLAIASPPLLFSLSLATAAIANFSISAPAAAANLTSWKFDPSTAQLEVTLPTGITPRYFLLAQPARIVMDLPSVEIGSLGGQQTFGGAVRSVRVSQFQPGLTRIVLELSPDAVLAPEQVELQQVANPAGGNTRWTLRPLLVDADTTPFLASVTPAPEPSETDEPSQVAIASPDPERASSEPPPPSDLPTEIMTVPAQTPPVADVPSMPAATPVEMPAEAASTLSSTATPAASAAQAPAAGPVDIPVELPAETATVAEPQADVPAIAAAEPVPSVAIAPTTVTTEIPTLDAAAAEHSNLGSADSLTTESASSGTDSTAAPMVMVPPPILPAPEPGAIEIPVQTTPVTPAPASVEAIASSPAPSTSTAALPSPAPTPEVELVEPQAIAPTSQLSASLPPAVPPDSQPVTVTVPPLDSNLSGQSAPVTQAPGMVVVPPLDASASSLPPEPSPEFPVSPSSVPSVAVAPTNPNVLLPSGTLLSLRYPGRSPLELPAEESWQEVLVLNQPIYDAAGNQILPAGSQVIGRFETSREGSRFVTQAIALPGRNLPLAAESDDLKGDREVSRNNLIRNSAIGAVGGTLLGVLTGGIGLLGLALGAATGATASYVTAPQPAIIQPNQIVEVRLIQDLPRL